MAVTSSHLINLKYIEQAIYYAERSTLKRHGTGAVITQGNPSNQSMLASGWSHMSEYNLVAYRSIHAEIHAILRTGRKEWLNGATIYIATIANKSGNITLARPCDQCLAILHEAGIKRAVFTTDNPDLDYEELIINV